MTTIKHNISKVDRACVELLFGILGKIETRDCITLRTIREMKGTKNIAGVAVEIYGKHTRNAEHQETHRSVHRLIDLGLIRLSDKCLGNETDKRALLGKFPLLTKKGLAFHALISEYIDAELKARGAIRITYSDIEKFNNCGVEVKECIGDIPIVNNC